MNKEQGILKGEGRENDQYSIFNVQGKDNLQATKEAVRNE
jgi:hypothetical protein